MPIPEKANSVMLLRPMTTAPAARSRATATASAVAGAASRRTFEPAVVTSPAMSKRSLIETGRPASGDGTTPSLRSRSEAGAARRGVGAGVRGGGGGGGRRAAARGGSAARVAAAGGGGGGGGPGGGGGGGGGRRGGGQPGGGGGGGFPQGSAPRARCSPPM